MISNQPETRLRRACQATVIRALDFLAKCEGKPLKGKARSDM